jgi:hypothetical protein
MRLVDKIRLLAEFSPLLSIAQDIAATDDAYDRAVLAMRALDFLAEKSPVEFDDVIVHHVKEVLGSEEGRAAFNAAVEGIKQLLKKED